MSETKEAVDRLRELCKEALLRTREETHPDFTFGLEPIENEIASIANWLRSDCSEFRNLSGPPFTLTQKDYSSAKQIDGKTVWGFKDCLLCDPYTSHGILFRVWEDTTGSPSTVPLGEQFEIAREYYPGDEPLFARHTPKYRPDFLRSTVYQYLERWVRFLTAASEKLGTSSTAAAASPQTGTEVEKQTSKEYTVDEVCRELCKQENGRRTLRQILELVKSGKTPSQIAFQKGGRRGFSLANISEKLKAVRERFPGFLPDEVQ
jgi:hypothetical protein